MRYESIAAVNGRVVGRIGQDSGGRYVLRYDESWRNAPDAFPLSLSLPLSRAEHPDDTVRAYLANLLPDNATILSAWARRYQVSANNPLALLSHVGEECPGALQLLSPERAEEVLSAEEGGGEVVEWLSDDGVARRLRHLRREPGAWREPGDPGQFSLAGAQPKIALLFRDGRWGVPSGRVPTTHILKPPVQQGMDGFAENEHVCLCLARMLDLPAARSVVQRFGDQAAIVVERYDRREEAGLLVRLHQEDFCQALGVMPDQKYEADGGPSAVDVLRTLARYSVDADADLATFVGALALNWVIGGTDAHAKNYSHLVLPGGVTRLAPLYDLISLLPYREGEGPRVKLAMKIGGEYRMRAIARRHWERLASAAGIPADAVLAIVGDVVERVPDALSDVCRETAEEGRSHPVLKRLQKAVGANVAQCRAMLAKTG